MIGFIRNLKVRKKLMLMVGTSVVSIVVLGVVSLFFLNQVNQMSTEINTNWLPSVISAQDLNNYTSLYRILEYKHIVSSDEAEMKNIEAQMNEQRAAIEECFKTYDTLATNATDRALKDKGKTDWDKYLKISTEISILSAGGDMLGAMKLMNGESLTIFNDITETMNQLVTFNKDGADAASKEGDSTSALAGFGITAGIILIVIICVILAALIIHVIMQPVKELELVTRKIADGDLDAKLTYQSRDEFGELVENFSRTVVRLQEYVNYIDEIAEVLDKLSNGYLEMKLTYEYAGEFAKVKKALLDTSSALISTMKQIGETSDSVASSASQLSSGSQILAEGATDQAGTVEELVATITDVSDKIGVNAQNAGEANHVVEVTTRQVDDSNQQMQEMIVAMDNISEKSKKIANIIASIEDIASQTNLLSLNASIEAARAGEAGRGFAVVAEQVKTLAAQSANAAQDVVNLVNETLQAVDNGSRIAGDTADSLKKVVTSITQVSDSVNQIAQASIEQAESMRQIEEGVEEISSVVQSNSATAQESAAASEELDAQSQVLRQLIGKFKF